MITLNIYVHDERVLPHFRFILFNIFSQQKINSDAFNKI